MPMFAGCGRMAARLVPPAGVLLVVALADHRRSYRGRRRRCLLLVSAVCRRVSSAGQRKVTVFDLTLLHNLSQLDNIKEGVPQEHLEELSELPLGEHPVAVDVRGDEEGLQAPVRRRLQPEVLVELAREVADLLPLQDAVPVGVELAEVLLASVLEHRGAAEEDGDMLRLVGVGLLHGGARQVPEPLRGVPRVAVGVGEGLQDAVRPDVRVPLLEPVEDLAPLRRHAVGHQSVLPIIHGGGLTVGGGRRRVHSHA
mmetsp:Transcript_15326/g.43836  ORF Transcript_15326/g.43836 Transcript_15326/m.43836 type:complete len:255 (-) Transcript_15326:4-768(-)